MLSSLAKSKDACNLNRVLESIVLWFFWFYMARQTELLSVTRLTGSSMAVDSKRFRMSATYEDVMNFLLRTYATVEIIGES